MLTAMSNYQIIITITVFYLGKTESVFQNPVWRNWNDVVKENISEPEIQHFLWDLNITTQSGYNIDMYTPEKLTVCIVWTFIYQGDKDSQVLVV